jgi:hypothetical protein
MSGAAVTAWLRERHDIAQLQPLWDLVVAEVDVELAFSSTRARPNRFLNIRWALHRRIIEILDGIRELRRWISDEPAQLLKALHHQSLANDSARTRFALPRGGLSPQELDAAVTAAVLRHAVGQLKARRVQQADNVGHRAGLPGQSAIEVPGRDTAASQERPRLVRVARALTHPLVEATLQLIAEDRGTDQACRQPAGAR